MRYAHIVGVGGYLPERVLSNEELVQTLDSSDAWIQRRTGIRQRHIASKAETTVLMGTRAARAALHQAGMDPSSVELIVVATCTPEYWFPSTACQIQARLGATGAGAFDLSAACSGFVYALHMAGQAVRTGAARTALVIGTERMSRVMDWQDRSTCILFGDGAGAVVLEGTTEPGGLLASALGADGTQGGMLTLPVAYSNPAPEVAPHDTALIHNVMAMNGPQVFRFAAEVLVDAVRRAVGMAGLTMADVDLIVPHQANVRIVEQAARRLGIPLDTFFLNVAETANTSSASIPLALCEAAEAEVLQPGDHAVLVGFGGGMTWGVSLVEWSSLGASRRAAMLCPQTVGLLAQATNGNGHHG